MTVSCPICGFAAAQDLRFCGACGARLGGAHELPAEPGDRRIVTGLFADLSGFTPLAEQLDPEELSEVIQGCFSGLMEEVRSRGGWLEKQIGDALVAVFGAPALHEDDPLRAVRAAWAMHERMAAVNERVERRLGRRLELHIGINTGLVVMGPAIHTRQETGDDLVVLGDTMNTAARLQQVSRAGQTLVGEQTFAATEWAFEYRRLPPLQLKGKAERVVAYECLTPKAAAPGGRRRLAPSGAVADMVGRDRELHVLAERLKRLAAGEGGIVCVVGEAGLGKSRLAAEAHGRLEEGTVRWLDARSLSFGQHIPYLPFVEIVRRDAGIAEEDDDASAYASLERRARELLGGDAEELLPYLAVLLALEVPREPAERVRHHDPEAMRYGIFRAFRRLVERQAQEQPTVLGLEDFHWADESSYELLEHLLPLVRTAPLLVICLTRPELVGPAARLRELAAAEYADRTTELILQQLTPAESAGLARNLLRVELPPRLREIVDRAEGNPFFVEEVVRSLIDLGVVESGDTTGFRFAADVGAVELPETIQGVIMARVDRLGDDTKQVLRGASVIGRSFLCSVLRELIEFDAALDRRLHELEHLELIRETPGATEPEYLFKHALTQEAVYGSILLRRRRELHGRVGRTVERLFKGRLESFYPLLAHHYAQAEEWEKALEYLLRAGDRAGQIAADAEALVHYRNALAAYTHAFGDRWEPFQRAVLERKIGEAHFRRGEHEQAIDHLRRALAGLGDSYPTERRAIRTAILRELLSQLGYRLPPAKWLRRRAGEPTPESEERAGIYEDLGWIHYGGDLEALLLAVLRDANRSERDGFAPGMATGWSGLSFAFDLVPLQGLADRYANRAIETAERDGSSLLAIGFARFSRGNHDFRLGRLATALEHCERSMDAHRRGGDLRRWAAVATLATRVRVLQGALPEAMTLIQEVIETGREAGDVQSLAWGLNQLGEYLWRSGRAAEAEEPLAEALAIFEAVPDPNSVVIVSGDLAQAAVLDGRVDDALDRIAGVTDLIARHRLRGFPVARCRLARAEAMLLAAERAPDDRKRLLREARSACKAAFGEARLDRTSRPAAERLEARRRWLDGDRRRAAKHWRKSLAASEAMGARYELMVSALELGRWAGDPDALARGRRLATELGLEGAVFAGPEPEPAAPAAAVTGLSG